MAERLKEILNKVLEWWNKFSTKQKTFIVSAGAGLILAFAILITILMKPQYVVLMNCENTKEAAKVTELLENEGLDYKVSDDAYQIKINQKQQSQASMLLAVNDVQAYTYTIDNVWAGSAPRRPTKKEDMSFIWRPGWQMIWLGNLILSKAPMWSSTYRRIPEP